MKKLLLSASVLLCLLVMGFVLNTNSQGDLAEAAALELAENADLSGVNNLRHGKPYLQSLSKKYVDPQTGTIDVPYFEKVLKKINAGDYEPAQKALENDIVWEELGPVNVGGRTRALEYDIDDVNILYAGMVSGGMFKSTDNGLNWVSLPNAAKQGLNAVTALTMTAEGDLYAGTVSSFEGLSQPGGGYIVVPGSSIWVSSDRGENWDPVVQEGLTAVNRLATQVVNGEVVVYAATGSGLRVKVGDGDFESVTNSICDDVVIAGTEGRVYAHSGSKFVRSDNGIDFVETAPLLIDGQGNSIALSQGNRRVYGATPADEDVLYIASVRGDRCLDRIVRSLDGGVTFELIGQNSFTFDPAFLGEEFGCQGIYDLCIDVDPNNSDRIYFGAVTLWRWDVELGWDQVDTYAGDPTVGKYVHPDKQGLFYHPTDSKKLFTTTDGAMFYTENADDDFPFWIERVKGYITYQCNGIGAGHNGEVMAGAQDNGTSLITGGFNSSQTGVEVIGGDGTLAEISNIDSDIMFAGINSGVMFRSTNGGQGFACALDDGDQGFPLARPDECAVDSDDFVHPFYLWEDPILYHSVAHWTPEETIDEQYCIDNPELFSYFHPFSGQIFVVTCNQDLLDSQLINETLTPSPYYTEPIVYVEFDVEIQSIDPKETAIRRGRLFTGSKGGGNRLWMAEQAIDGSSSMDWKLLGDGFGGEATSFSSSKTGDIVAAGSTVGGLIKVSGLNSALANSVTVMTSGQPFSGRYITDVQIDPANANHCVVVTGGFSAGAHVFESNNFLSAAPTFTSIQANLPSLPVLSMTFLEGNNTNSGNTGGDILLGTFYGLYYGEKIAEGQYQWEEQSGEIGRLPVFALRAEPMARYDQDVYQNAYVVYAAIHGRGMWRTTAFTNANVPEDVYALPAFTVGLEDGAPSLEGIKLYPNPAIDNATMEVNILKSGSYAVNVYDLSGRKVQSINAQKFSVGKQSISIDVSALAGGNYIVSFENGKVRETAQLTVSK